jgi:signal transduction histidine kinase
LGLELLSDELNNSRTDSEEVNGYRDCVDQIREAAGIAVEILNDLLQYDKMQDNALQIQKSPHRAIEMVNEIFNTFKIQVRTKKWNGGMFDISP